TADTPIELPPLPDRVPCFVRQQDFYTILSEEDADRFESFCRSRPKQPGTSARNTPEIPALLLFPGHRITAVYAERYTARLLSRDSYIPGMIANALGQTPLLRLRELLPNHHLILSLLFSSLEELYSTTSPLLAGLPALAADLVTEMEKCRDQSLYTTTLPFLCSYRRELQTTDIPVFLDLTKILPLLTGQLERTPSFDGLSLYITADLAMYPPEMFQVRFPVSVFTHVFVLLSYLTALFSDTGLSLFSLYRDGIHACLTFKAECDLLPAGFSARNEFVSLINRFPRYRNILTAVQYLLHRHQIDFTVTAAGMGSLPSLSITLYMDTRFREEIEFRSGDVDILLAENLPDSLALLQYLEN
ncbi:MAG: hypothetical protein IKV57_06755, partial [Clostridia bacterium]|nr:hypothetical protein [Clostridia bacterium]